jgi:hypothetical protein
MDLWLQTIALAALGFALHALAATTLQKRIG